MFSVYDLVRIINSESWHYGEVGIVIEAHCPPRYQHGNPNVLFTGDADIKYALFIEHVGHYAWQWDSTLALVKKNQKDLLDKWEREHHGNNEQDYKVRKIKQHSQAIEKLGK